MGEDILQLPQSLIFFETRGLSGLEQGIRIENSQFVELCELFSFFYFSIFHSHLIISFLWIHAEGFPIITWRWLVRGKTWWKSPELPSWNKPGLRNHGALGRWWLVDKLWSCYYHFIKCDRLGLGCTERVTAQEGIFECVCFSSNSFLLPLSVNIKTKTRTNKQNKQHKFL